MSERPAQDVSEVLAARRSAVAIRRWFLAVLLIALACLAIRAARVGMAGDYLDPVAKISAQDEALYAHSAIRMAQSGNRLGEWLTPRFMGRLALYKPPLLIWAAGLSARVFGVSRVGLRLPVVFISSLAIGWVFLIAARIGRRWETGACAALLLLSSRLWLTAGAMVLTDCLLASCEIAAFYCLLVDPEMKSRRAFWGFAAAIAGAVLTKGVAGVLPIAGFGLWWLVLYCIAAPVRPSLRRASAALAIAFALVAPWYAYQMAAHGRWFWAEHIQLEIFGAGGGSMPQTTAESHALFYLKRMWMLSPALLVLALAAIPAWFSAIRRRSPEAVLLACWLAPVLGAVFVWHYRNAAYLIPALAPMAVAAAVYAPVPARWMKWVAAILAVGFAVTVNFSGGTIQTAAAPLANYCGWNRGNELIIGDAVDDLYATTLPLAKLRYAIVGPSLSAGQDTLDFPSMGITVTAAQFNNLSAWMPQFERRLRAWGVGERGVGSDEPIATLIVAPTAGSLMDVALAHPQSDFFLPDRFRAAAKAANGAGHEWAEAAPSFFWLLSRTPVQRSAPPAWTCNM